MIARDEQNCILCYLSEERHLQGLQTALQAARYPCRLSCRLIDPDWSAEKHLYCGRDSARNAMYVGVGFIIPR